MYMHCITIILLSISPYNTSHYPVPTHTQPLAKPIKIVFFKYNAWV